MIFTSITFEYENHLEVFDYEIDQNLRIPFLLLDIEQNFIFHIFDAEVFLSIII